MDGRMVGDDGTERGGDLPTGDRGGAPRARKKGRLKEGISRLNDLGTPEECDALLKRVLCAKAATLASIEHRKSRGAGLDLSEEELDWMRRARCAVLAFDGAIRRIEGRIHLLGKRQTVEMKAHRSVLNVEQATAQAYLAAKREEEKTERHRIDRAHQSLAVVRVIRLIRDKGLLSAETMAALFQEAEAASGDGSIPAVPPSVP
jgi:hypothetical protein